MSFINWGSESPEQKRIRKRFEEEQAIVNSTSIDIDRLTDLK